MRYICSNCGSECYYDGRCADDPILICNCSKHKRWINDGRGGYEVYVNNAHPVCDDEKYYDEDDWEHIEITK